MPSDLAISSGAAREGTQPPPAALADFLPEMLRHDLTREQLAAIERAAIDWSKARGRTLPVDLRLSVPLPFRRIFFNVAAGREQRGPQRRAEERLRRPVATVGNVLAMTFVVSLLYGGLLLAALALSGIVE